MTRLVLETRGCPAAGVASFSRLYRPSTAEDRPQLASLAAFLGSALARRIIPAAAIKHLELAVRLSA